MVWFCARPSTRSDSGTANAVKTTITKRILKLEIGAGLIETEESRREREFAEIITRRIDAGRGRVGLPKRTFTDSELSELARLRVEEILHRGRLRASGCALAEANEVAVPGCVID